MGSSTVTTKGQVVIPSELRKKYKISGGTKVNFVDEGGKIIIVPFTKDLVRKNFGILGTKGKLLKSLMEEKKTERQL